MKGTAKDPTLDRRTIYLRWFVLETLLPLPVNGRGTGAKLSALDLLELYRSALPTTVTFSKAPRSFDPVSARELGQAARHFALEAAGERCLYWVNADLSNADATFGVSREGRETAERLAAAYGGRLAALELATVPHDGFREPEVPEDLERVEIVAHVPPEVAAKLRDGGFTGVSMGARVERQRTAPAMPIDRFAEASSPAPDVAYTEKQEIQGMAMQNAGRGRRNLDEDDADAGCDQFAEKELPSKVPGPWEERELRARRDALRYNVVWDEKGNRIPGVRFAMSFRLGEDGMPVWTGVSFVPFREDPTESDREK